MTYASIETATPESIEAALDEAYRIVQQRHLEAKVFLSEPASAPRRTNLTQRKVDPDDYRKCAEEGLTVSETASRLGVHRTTARMVGRRYGIKFVNGRKVRGRT